MGTAAQIIRRMVEKVLSARFIVTVLLSATLCYAVKESFRIVGLTNAEGEIMAFRKEIFMYVMGMFSGIVGSVITSYFSRVDRKEPIDNGIESEKK